MPGIRQLLLGLAVFAGELPVFGLRQVEFWQGDKNRNHTRLNHRRSENGWHKELLWP